jgi:hypothetical protein
VAALADHADVAADVKTTRLTKKRFIISDRG